MTENLADDGDVQKASFAVYAEPPWLLHLSGELDLGSAPALKIALGRPDQPGGAVGLDLAELAYMGTTGFRVILKTVNCSANVDASSCTTLRHWFDASSRSVGSTA